MKKAPGDVAPPAECWKTIGVIGGDRSCPELLRHIHCRNCPVYAEAGVRLLDRALPPGYREEWSRRLAERKAETAAGKESVVVFRVAGEWLALRVQIFQEVAEWRVIRTLPHQRGNCVLGLATVRGELLVCISLERWLGVAARTLTAPTERRLQAAATDPSALLPPEGGVSIPSPVENRQSQARVAEADGARTVPARSGHGEGAVLEIHERADDPRAATGDRSRSVGERLLVVRQHGQRLAFPVEEVAGIVRHQPQDLKPVAATMRREGGPSMRGLLDWKGQTVGLLDERQLFNVLSQNFS